MDTRILIYVTLSVVVSIVSSQHNLFEEPRQQIVLLNAQESKNIKTRAYPNQHVAQNRVNENLEGGHRLSDSLPSPAQQLRKHYPIEVDSYQNVIPVRPAQQQKRPLTQKELERLQEEEDELEKEEPDRLSQLLPNSKFDCVGRNTGYYADEGLACEIFHYCQDNTKHSWICPDGFTFHQVHLICMPPSSDNICQKSSQYHFVNDYLYKPLNAEEAQARPNVTLRYSDRFYPSEVYHDGRFDDDADYNEREQIAPPRRAPARTTPGPTPGTVHGLAPSRRPQVFRSPEEVDIPLLQRRPPHIPQPFHPSNNQDFEYEK